MHIGVDLDNTVLDATTSHLLYYNKASGRSLTCDDVDDFYLYRHYGWNEKEMEVVYNKYGYDIHWNSTPLPMAVEILNSLSKVHKISIITARPLQFRDVTIEWLTLHKINYNYLVFTENKLQECIDSKVDVMIDDGPHYAEEFSQLNRPVILYNQPYNVSILYNNYVYRASNWNEVQNHINDIEQSLQPSLIITS